MSKRVPTKSYVDSLLEQREKIQQYIERLKSKDPTLTILDLSKSHISPVQTEALAEALKGNTTLTEVNFDSAEFNCHDAMEVERNLDEHKDASRAVLARIHYLNGNEENTRGAIAILNSLKENKSLKTINVRANNIGPELANIIVEILKENSSITNLGLVGNLIGSLGIIIIAQALANNQSVEEISLSSNNVDSEAANYIAEALKRNKSLKSLELGNNNIGSEGVEHIAEALKTNQSLTHVSLGQNNMGLLQIN